MDQLPEIKLYKNLTYLCMRSATITLNYNVKNIKPLGAYIWTASNIFTLDYFSAQAVNWTVGIYCMKAASCGDKQKNLHEKFGLGMRLPRFQLVLHHSMQ